MTFNISVSVMPIFLPLPFRFISDIISQKKRRGQIFFIKGGKGCFKKGGYHLLDPRPWRGRSYELGSVRLSVLLSFRPEVFLELTDQFFYETQHGVRGLCVVVRESRIFLKNLSQKWVKNRGFLIYWKIQSLIVSEFGL